MVDLHRVPLRVAMAASLMVAALAAPAHGSEPTYVAFTPDSYWNTPTGGPPDPNSALWIAWLQDHSAYPYPRLAVSKTWGIPVYWPADGDPSYTITPTQYGRAVTMRIPLGAMPSSGTDAALVTIDRGRSETVSLWGATFDGAVWHAKATARYELASDGLCTSRPNFGHRGVAPPAQAIREDEIEGGLIAHKLEVFIPGTANAQVSPPMCGSEPNKGGVIPEGAVLRVKPSVDLSKLQLSPSALVVAQALQAYGAVVGDNDPNTTSVKCDTHLVGQGLLTWSSLAALPFSAFEFADR